MITHINHIGIAVNSLTKHIPFYRDVLKLEFEGVEEINDQSLQIAMFRVGEVRIELLEPTSPQSTVAKFLTKNGEGLHHIAYETDDIETQIKNFKAQDIKMIDEEARMGAHGSKIAFVHPQSSGRVLTEICQSE